ncbi:MAG: hypothetical protein QF749_08380 [Verrucomicrobiota bacterium]|jgi:hypothetical protein|nr:hypothetical protein [Verrucomicrobiota bacterium]MDP6252878.1 hypothetical protein [Verrucomicrobiota bacterium]MDP7178295.1 hypothetical protein [Verrucomicrobiota bacterium]MDP7293085.1 hypothetical protein [Verrucomicrobiota bacterium]MDP7442512.1 hypothetical protein [Verrucomicrobiota bacterium]
MAIANADSPERIANIAVEDSLNLRHLEFLYCFSISGTSSNVN